jgi:plasmid stabilization system protein ParE
MGPGSKPVRWRARARNSLQYLYDYISIDAPLNAGKYINRLIDFGDSLADFPSKFPLCRYEQFSENEFHCAVFEKKLCICLQNQRPTSYYLQYSSR